MEMEKDRFLSCILLQKMTSASFLESHLKIFIQISVFLHSSRTLNSLSLSISVLLPNCSGLFTGIQQRHRCHPTYTTRVWRQISTIVCARKPLRSWSVGTTEKTHPSTLLTETAQLVTDCQAHQSSLNAFTTRLNAKPNQRKQCGFVSSFWNLLPYK